MAKRKKSKPPSDKGTVAQRALGPAADKFGRAVAPLGKEVGEESVKVGRILLSAIKGLPLKDWNAVEIAALAVEHFRNFHTAPRSSGDASDAMAETGKPVLRDITAGLEALSPYVLDDRRQCP